MASNDGGAGGQQVEEAFFDTPFGFGLDAFLLLFADQADGVFDQFADHAFDVAAVVADFGVFGGFDLDEWRAGQFGQPPGDLGFSDAGRADHHDVLGRDFLAHIAFELLAAPAVADGDGHGPLGRVLADDMPIEFFHDLTRGQVSHCGPSSLSLSGVSCYVLKRFLAIGLVVAYTCRYGAEHARSVESTGGP